MAGARVAPLVAMLLLATTAAYTPARFVNPSILTGRRTSFPVVCSAPSDDAPLANLTPPSDLTPPEVNDELIEQVRAMVWRTAEPSLASELREEQRGAFVTTLRRLVAMHEAQEAAAVDEEEAAAALGQAELDAAIAPQLPLLMMRGFPTLVRTALSQVKTPAQQRALLAMNTYMVGLYTEVADRIGDLQWQQLNKLRELCDAAMDGGTPRNFSARNSRCAILSAQFSAHFSHTRLAPLLSGTEALADAAEAMGDALDTDFVNYLNAAVDEEERRLVKSGIRPERIGGPILPELVGSAIEGANDGQEVGKGAAAIESLPPPPAPAAAASRPPAPGARPGDDALAERKDGDGGPLAAQRWLLVLRLVRQGVYATLARDYEDDVRQLRQILALGSAESRRELTVRTLLALPDEERAHFAATVGRIAGNLAVGRDARDAELHAKVSEVQAHVDAYQTMYAAGEGSPL